MTRIAKVAGVCVLGFCLVVLVADGGRWIGGHSGERTDPTATAKLIEDRDDRGIGAASARGRLGPSAIRVRKGARAFYLRATARGLYPGVRKPLRVKISNRSRFAIKITRIRVGVKRDRTHGSCPPGRYVRKTGFTKSPRVGRRTGRRVIRPIKIRPRRSRHVRLTIKLLYSAPDACQGAAFPLRVRGRAVRA